MANAWHAIPESVEDTNLHYFSSITTNPRQFTLQTVGENAPKNAIFSLIAPRNLWKSKHDRINETPSSIIIKLNPKSRDKRRTPVVQRLERLQKKVYRMYYGIKDESKRQKYLEEEDSVFILAGELENEAVNELFFVRPSIRQKEERKKVKKTKKRKKVKRNEKWKVMKKKRN